MIYDELGYPSGIAGGLFYTKYPELAEKSIEITETNVTGPAGVQLTIPRPLYLGAVMMNLESFDRIDISNRKSGERGGVPGSEGKLESDGILPERRLPPGIGERRGRGLSRP